MVGLLYYAGLRRSELLDLKPEDIEIEAHINLLTGIEDFKERKRLDKIIDFILDGFSKIYDAPYQKEKKTKATKDSEELLIKNESPRSKLRGILKQP